MKRIALALAAGLAVCMGPAAAQAPWPSQPIKWIVPYPPGGSTDMLARLVSHKLGERLGQPVIVENKAGAGGNVGTDFAVKQPADGYTIVMGNIGPISINPALYPDLPYRPQRDLAPVTMLMSVPNLLVVNPALPVRSVQELIAYARKAPEPMGYATPGAGTSLHLAGELFASSAGLRLTQLPDVPTMAEAGLAGYEIAGWFGVLAPAATPNPVVERLNQELLAVLALPDVREQIGAMGGIIAAEGPAGFGRYIASETEKWGALVRTAQIKL